ncbi:D-lactaldehyde dehydrogenase [Hymenopellis radicata]|nr:D-lactaldehyde dehydrogenase [Hymenopellis radicata]
MPALANTNATILVTGANGYLATYIVGDLLKKGYTVHAAVRSEAKGAHLLELYKVYGDKLKLAIVEDITKVGAFDDAVKGVQGIVHTATPMNLAASHPSELIDPAVGGITGILNSALKNGTSLERVVFTSSCAAISVFSMDKVTLSETDWNEPALKACEEKGKDASVADMYCASKVLSERTAWSFVEQHKAEIKWDLAVFCPPWILGPPIHAVSQLSSVGYSLISWYNAIINGDFQGYSPLIAPGQAWVDVRDVALSHVAALEVPAARGERVILAESSFVWQDFLDVANALTPAPYTKKPLTKGTPGDAVHGITFDTAKEKRIFGRKFRTMEETARDMLADFEKRGW